jgi:hypothetical protein
MIVIVSLVNAGQRGLTTCVRDAASCVDAAAGFDRSLVVGK